MTGSSTPKSKLPLPKIIFFFANVLFNYFFPIYKFVYFIFKKKQDKLEIELIKKYVKSGDVVLDIGANIGFYSNIISSLVGKDGMVHAFEPDPINFKHLQSVTKGLKNIKINNLAVADKQGELKLYTSTLLNVDHRTYKTDDYGKSFTVKADTIDNYLDGNRKVDFIKMDIQGAEVYALHGMSKTIDANPQIKILSEIEPFGLKASGASVDEFYDFIISKNFKIHLIKNNTLVPLTNFKEIERENKKDYYFNILLSKTEI